jgi:hypothetical protein
MVLSLSCISVCNNQMIFVENCDLLKNNRSQIKFIQFFYKRNFVFLVLVCSSKVLVLRSLDSNLVMSTWKKEMNTQCFLIEDIDHIVHNVVFECLVLNLYGNSSISSTFFLN